LTGIIPVLNLEADENPNYNNQEIDSYGKPVLVAHMFYHSAK
jgi:hypothetical protein